MFTPPLDTDSRVMNSTDSLVSKNRLLLKIDVQGIVQGVGFRPFVYSLALRFHITGTVHNHTAGVTIIASGLPADMIRFVAAIRSEAPPAASIAQLETTKIPEQEFDNFQILPSAVERDGFTHLPADLSLCEDCRRELLDPTDRRFLYPLINCTNCGPRFTIIRELPYDRPATTMADFKLCDICAAEYENPLNRRFHAQPVACEVCGPRVEMLRASDRGWTTVTGDAVSSFAAELRKGAVGLLQGVGGFHICCDAANDSAVSRLRERKCRERKPLALMFPTEASLRQSCDPTEEELRLLRSSRAPIVLVKRKPDAPVSPFIAGENPYFGVMLPYSPLHALLLNKVDIPLVMTSANISDDPISYDRDDALYRMQGIADFALLHYRAIHMFADDSIVKIVDGKARLWRRARGYVPEPITVPSLFCGQILAFGPQMKNTFCLGRGNVALLSQHLGDLDSEAAIHAQKAALSHFERIYRLHAEVAACDLHPDYTSTRLAEEYASEHAIPLTRVQHHHAHLVACQAENGVTDETIGVILDGTGYGADGAIWGGELLIGNARSFRRFAHLDYTAMPGGERAAREPWRMAAVWLHKSFDGIDDELSEFLRARWKNNIHRDQLDLLLTSFMMTSVYPSTSSAGRLFDAVAALLYFGSQEQFEGQAAMGLEWLADSIKADPYPLDIQEDDCALLICPQPMFRQIIADLKENRPVSEISCRFHETIVDGFAHACIAARDATGIGTVALSGGCFQNAFLLTRFSQVLQERGFRVLTHSQIPCNDGGVSLGQAYVANEQEA